MRIAQEIYRVFWKKIIYINLHLKYLHSKAARGVMMGQKDASFHTFRKTYINRINVFFIDNFIY